MADQSIGLGSSSPPSISNAKIKEIVLLIYPISSTANNSLLTNFLNIHASLKFDIRCLKPSNPGFLVLSTNSNQLNSHRLQHVWFKSVYDLRLMRSATIHYHVVAIKPKETPTYLLFLLKRQILIAIENCQQNSPLHFTSSRTLQSFNLLSQTLANFLSD